MLTLKTRILVSLPPSPALSGEIIPLKQQMVTERYINEGRPCTHTTHDHELILPLNRHPGEL